MDPLILLAIYASLGYFGGMAALSYAGVRLLREGKAKESIACFRAGALLNLSPQGRLIMQSNLIAALTVLGDLDGANREWAGMVVSLPQGGRELAFATACYAACLVRQGRYEEGLQVLSLGGSLERGSILEDARWEDSSRVSVGAKGLLGEGQAMRLLQSATCLLELGRFEEARESLELAIELRPQSQILRQNLELYRARLAWCTGQMSEAYALAHSVRVDSSPAVYLEIMLLQKALILAISGYPDEAEDLLDRRVSVASSRGFYLRPLLEGVVAELRGSYGDAQRLYRAAMRSGQPAGEAAWRGGFLAERHGRFSEALSYFEEAVNVDSESWWARSSAAALVRLREKLQG